MQKKSSLSPQDAARLKRAMRTPRPCLLCGAFPPYTAGLFVPYTAECGAKPGKIRGFVYTLCAACFSTPESPKRVEDHCKARVRAESELRTRCN